MSKQQIVSEIQNYIIGAGGNYGDWYVGISKNAKDRLMNGHGVNEKTDKWIYRIAVSDDEARDVEDFFINKCGTKGGPGGGDESAMQVYAYKITSTTTE